MTTEQTVCGCERCVGSECTCGCQAKASTPDPSCQCGDVCTCGPTCTCDQCQHATMQMAESR